MRLRPDDKSARSRRVTLSDRCDAPPIPSPEYCFGLRWRSLNGTLPTLPISQRVAVGHKWPYLPEAIRVPLFTGILLPLTRLSY